MTEGIKTLNSLDPQALASIIQSLAQSQKGYAETGGNFGPTVYDAHRDARTRDALVQKYLGDVSETRDMTDAMNQIIERNAQTNKVRDRGVTIHGQDGEMSPELSDEQGLPRVAPKVNQAAALAAALKGPIANVGQAATNVKLNQEVGGEALENTTAGEQGLEGLDMVLDADKSKRPDMKIAKTNKDALTESAAITATSVQNQQHDDTKGDEETTQIYAIDPATGLMASRTMKKSRQSKDSAGRTDTVNLTQNATVKSVIGNKDQMDEIHKKLGGPFEFRMVDGKLRAYSATEPTKFVPIEETDETY